MILSIRPDFSVGSMGIIKRSGSFTNTTFVVLKKSEQMIEDTDIKLKFGYIIPFSEGGANTYRNIQLLCQHCNRSKSDSIG